MERQLPIYTIEGTDFIVDVERLELREKEHPENCIDLFSPYEAIRDEGDGYVMDYDPENHRPAPAWELPGMVQIKLPELVTLDPVGMAAKYGYTLEAMTGKNDFEVMVDQKIFRERVLGQPVTLEISGHRFIVDIPGGVLQPETGYPAKAIRFKDIRDYCDQDNDTYTIPFHPEKGEFMAPDYNTLTEIPATLIVVCFPHEEILDPVGYNRHHGFEDNYRLKATGVQSHFKATEGDWSQLVSEKTLVQNRLKLQQHQQVKEQQDHAKHYKRSRGIGR